jgi:mono/diheme cytochrome c family protein
MRATLFSLPLVLTVLSVAAATSSQPSEPPGKAPFLRVCSTCHGENAEGSQGPRIARIEMDYEEFLAKVRHGGGEMPAISTSQMSDDEVKQVLEFLKSL